MFKLFLGSTSYRRVLSAAMEGVNLYNFFAIGRLTNKSAYTSFHLNFGMYV